MIDLEIELAVSCETEGNNFRVYVVKNHVKIDITAALSDYEIKSLMLKYQVKWALEPDFDR